MFADILSLQYDSCHPDYSLTLVNSLRSYINLKLDHEKKTPEFIAELQRRLYFIHEYNCQVAKVAQEYPQSRQFELLLIKYVELEYDALYSRNPYPSQEVEVAAELRILRLLQVMLYSTVHNNESLVNKHTDRAVKKAVLQLLGEVKPTYLVKNKLICNIANKLLKRVHGNSKKFHITQSDGETHRNLATSDYGSEDSDSDFESNIFSTKLFTDGTLTGSRESSKTSDCVEVPLTSNGLAAIPTIEFTDDEDNYFVYLQKRVPTKRKLQDDCKTGHRKKNVSEIASNIITNKNALKCSKNSNSKENTKANKHCNNLNKVSENLGNHSNSCVIVCSDSEEEVGEVTLNTNETCNKASGSRSNDKVSSSEENVGVVTFEILDDDDDNETNYMVYLQKEVETNVRLKNSKEINTDAVIICSDTEDESSENRKFDTVMYSKGSDSRVTSLQKSSSNQNAVVPLTQAKLECTLEQSEGDLPNLSTSRNDHLQENPVGTVCPKDNLNKVTSETGKLQIDEAANFTNNDQGESVSNEKITVNPEPNTPHALISKSADTNYLNFNHEVGPTTDKNLNGNFLVDPTIIFEQMSQPHFQKSDLCFQNRSAVDQMHDFPTPAYTEPEPGANIPGGPVTSEKVDGFEDLGNVSECRINESLLEEILLDDTYLLEGRKEFEELEYFLFNDNTDRQGFSLSNFSFDDNEMVPPPETFDADIKSLESFLDDSQLISVINSKSGTHLDSSNCFQENNSSTKKVNSKKTCNTLDKEKCVSKTRKSPCSSRNYSRTVCKRTNEINR